MAEKYSFVVDVDTLNAIKKLKAVGEEAREVGAENVAAAKKASGAWETFQGVLGAQAVIGAFKAIGSAATGAFGTILEATKNTETIKTELATMTGSIKAAEATYADLQKFASKTPFEINGIANSAKQLLAFGFDASTVTEKLQGIGDVASGSGNSLQDLTQIFGQVSAAGKLTGERFNQLQERAVPIGAAIAKTMNVTEAAVKDLVSEGKVSFKDFEKAFQSLSSEGGIFFDGMNKKSQTLDGVLSSMSDAFGQSASDIGNSFLPALRDAVVAITSMLEANRELIKSFSQKIGTAFIEFLKDGVELGIKFVDFVQENENAIKVLGGALLIGAGAWGAYAAGVTAAAGAQAAFAAFNPVVLALAAAATAISATIVYVNELSLVFLNLVDNMASLAQGIPGLGAQMTKLRESVALTAAQIQKDIDAKEAAKVATEDLTVKTEDSANRIVAAQKKQVDTGAQLNKDELKAAEEHQKSLAELKLQQRIAEEELKIVDGEKSTAENEARLTSLIEQLGREQGIKAESQLRAYEAEKVSTENTRQQELIREQIKLDALKRSGLEKEKADAEALKKEQEQNKKLAEEQKKASDEAKKARDGDLLYFMNQKDREADFTAQTERQKLDTVRGAFTNLALLSRDGNKRLGEIGKAAAIAGATIDTYKAATGAYAALAGIPVVGPALGVAAAAAAVTAGLANVRQINTQRYERGGIVAGSSYTGDNIGVRVNSGELILNRAQQKNLAPQLMGGDDKELLYAINGVRQDLQNLKLIIGDEEVFNAVLRQKEAGRQI